MKVESIAAKCLFVAPALGGSEGACDEQIWAGSSPAAIGAGSFDLKVLLGREDRPQRRIGRIDR
jgi:hypothetical protein